jgi:hypothetical protein
MVIAFVHDSEHIRKSQAAARKIDFLGIIYLALGLGLSAAPAASARPVRRCR